ncbi:ABC transporter ATP-binding protein [Alphaproteobacteria bacterium]|nr:ABC transporter ATP-binding protein [Alphaproteobacteria bacterium]
MSNLIKVKNISKSFGSFLAVNDISFSLSKGEVLGFLGPNGAGKTTTMRILTGFLKPDTGSVQIKDIDIFNEAKKAREYLGYVPEGSPLYNEMTTIDFLSFICNIRQVNRVTELPKIIELLDLSDVLLQKIDTLSKGFKRRVGLAQALIHDPEVLILDEPTDGLDPNQKNEVRKLIKKLGKEKAIIISTHILEEVNLLCNRTMILSNGNLLIDDKPSNVLKRSKYYNNTIVAVEEVSAKDLRRELLVLGKFDNVEIKDNMCLINVKKTSKNFSLTNYLKKQRYTIKHFSINKGDLDEVFRSLTKTN